MSDYYLCSGNKKSIEKQINRLRLNVLKDLSKLKCNTIHSIVHRDFVENSSSYFVNIVDKDKYFNQYLPASYEYLIIGDVHENVVDLKNLLIRSGFQFDLGNHLITGCSYDNKRIVLVGDYLDKGNNTKEIIDFLYDNQDWFYFIIGNHERFVYSVLLDSNLRFDGDTDYFSSLSFFENPNNSVYKDKFLELYKLSSEEYIVKSPGLNRIHITHSPVPKKYLGKLSSEALRKKVKLAIDYDNLSDNLSNFENYLENSLLKFLSSESEYGEPFHIFGHIATKEPYRVGNRIGLDTGCCYGNVLTGVRISRGRAYYSSVSSSCDIVSDLPVIFSKKSVSVDLNDLDINDWKKINYALNHKINYVSGTMSPADKDIDTFELESLEKGLDYFKDNGISKVILEPKFMGSRCNIYLYRNLSDCYAVSRNGYKISRVDLSSIFQKELSRHSQFMEENNLSMLLLDGELLPWSVLGEGLIDESFKPLSSLVGNELSLLKEYNFTENLSSLLSNDLYIEFKKERHSLSKSELVKKYGHHYETFKSLENHLSFDIESELSNLSIFNEQVDIFGNVSVEPYFECFNLLKAEDLDGNVVFVEGDSTFGDMESIFNLVSDNDYVVIDFTDSDYLLKAKDFYNTLTSNLKMEGIVIKPLVLKSNIAPYLKVRNSNYLTLVYGYDYKNTVKYNRLLDQKSIRRKLSVSISENLLSRELLKFPINSINKLNSDYISALANVLIECKNETSIDPRL